MDWNLPLDQTASDELRRAVGGHPLVADILARRGMNEPDEAMAFLDASRYQPSRPEELPDLVFAAERLHEAIRNGERILVWGDFDVDGQTSTALLFDALQGLGANASYHVPHRLTHGHGVQNDVLQSHIDKGVQVVLTCDTGVASHEAAELAKAAGVMLLITDHHALPETLPDAPAVVNPQRLPEGHPLRDLPGVGTAYQLAAYLYQLAGRGSETGRFLDLVALGIVSDVATQRHDTRYLLQQGIERLRFPQRVGLQALMRSAQVDPTTMSSDTIGFQVGPRLNALGRLDDARLAVELLTTSDELYAQQIAAQLEVLNGRRKQVEDQIYAAAQEQIAKDTSLLNFEVLMLGSPHWHPGVIGIVASRLVGQYGKPTVLLVAPEKGIARGSARSIAGVNIGACIAACADLLKEHGGHPGAAGMSLDVDYIPQFRRQLSNEIARTRDPNAVTGLQIDAEIMLDGLSMELAEDLNRLAPFGPGNPAITLMTSAVRLITLAAFGIGGKHRRLTVEDEQGIQHVLTWWRGSEHPKPLDAFDMVFIPRINDYKGRRSLQLEWVDSRPLSGMVVETGPRYEIVDRRGVADPLDGLSLDDFRMWAEGVAAKDLPEQIAGKIITRAEVSQSATLVIWTIPPGLQELGQMLEETQAKRVIVSIAHSPADSPQSFLERLAGLVKYALKVYGGEVSVIRLAAASGQREVTVRYGLDWLAAKGQISIEWMDADRAKLTSGGSQDEAALEPLQDSIRAMLAETAAFRAYFRQADLSRFIT